MSKLTLFHLFIIYICLYCLVDKAESQIIKEVYPYYMNVTAAYVSLENLNANKYVYFSYNFDDQKNLDLIFFKITTESELTQSNIQYRFTNKKAEEISKEDLEKDNAYWFYIRGRKFRSEKNEQGFDTYLKIDRYFKEKKALIIRLEIDKLKGDIMVENLESLPEIDSLINNNHKKKVKENKHNHHYNNNYYSQDKYHNNVINNEQRYSHNNDIHNRYYHYHKNWREHSHDRIYEISNLRIVYGLIIGQIWLIVLVLYCLVNRRKRNVPYIIPINNRI